MMASRGMGDIASSKMPKGKKTARRDDADFTQFAKGGAVGLYANIAAKRERGAKMRKPGQRVRPRRKILLILRRPQKE